VPISCSLFTFLSLTNEILATASYLAALYPKAQVTHIAPVPLSHRLFPNIVPHYSPVSSKAVLSLAQGAFTSVYCHAMPALIPSQDIPQLLKGINGCLVPKGTLRLTLIDPLPIASTMGPILRAWLNENLMANLETKFRCINPSKVFPHWLSGARLRGDGSIITKIRFRAVSSNLRSGPEMMDRADTKKADRLLKNELRTVVGRMLWQEVWGSYVNGASWWWETPGCLEECASYGTLWEYRLIEAVKDTK
jgi:hypothetical protein